MGLENVILPEPDPDTVPFWEASREGRLLLQHCTDCDAVQFPPRPICGTCRSTRLDWSQASGKGSVYSWTIVHYSLLDELSPASPYIVALIELEEGVLMVGNLRGCRQEEISANLPVRVVFEPIGDNYVLPQFEPN